MKNLLIILAIAFCLLPIACKTKQVQIEKSEEVVSDHRQTKKDSVFEQKTASKLAVFQVDNLQSFEMDLESEKDSTGQSKTLEFERIRSPSGEKIIVRGGKVKIKTSANVSEKITKKDTLQVNNTSVRTNIQESKTTESKSFKKEKEVKSQGFTFGFYLWLVVILLLLFLAWRLKFFGLMGIMITKFKRLLKMI